MSKIGFIETIKKAFNKEDKTDPMEQSLGKLGIKIQADKKLNQRLLALQALLDEMQEPIGYNAEKDIMVKLEPVEYIDELRIRLEKLNRAVHSLAAPFYRSGSNANFRQLMDGWHLIYALSSDWIHVVHDRVVAIQQNGGKTTKSQTENEKEQQQEKEIASIGTIDIGTLVRRLQAVLSMHIFQDGLLILSESYLTEDVAPSYTTIIQTMTPPQFGRTMPTSGGEISETYEAGKPKGGPYNKVLSSQVDDE